MKGSPENRGEGPSWGLMLLIIFAAMLVRDAALRLESNACSLDCIQKELERVAFVM